MEGPPGLSHSARSGFDLSQTGSFDAAVGASRLARGIKPLIPSFPSSRYGLSLSSMDAAIRASSPPFSEAGSSPAARRARARLSRALKCEGRGVPGGFVLRTQSKGSSRYSSCETNRNSPAQTSFWVYASIRKAQRTILARQAVRAESLGPARYLHPGGRRYA